MNCPFLKEAHVRGCTAAPVRKLIVEGQDPGAAELCSSPAHAECRVFRERAEANGGARCQFLDEQLVQYCSVAPVKKYIPYSESIISRCGGNNYQYCSLYLALAQPGYTHRAAGDDRDPVVEGVRVPQRLYYAPNHMWLNVGENGSCHIGVDGFLARLMGGLEHISYVAMKGVKRPAVTLTVEGMMWPLMFPNEIMISGVNQYLRSNPERLAADPYGSGWLFEGWESPGRQAAHGLLTGGQAVDWMTQEMERLTEFAHGCAAGNAGELGLVLNDGGAPDAGMLNQMGSDDVARLFNDFFCPQASWSRP
ncbi:MAG: hypothetical protein IH602_08605 [Bryobacteraceae bacterium]|jgi:glycine cleavage system H protein|nr:hypothetical protein [Bryobacteraceae bacterium]